MEIRRHGPQDVARVEIRRSGAKLGHVPQQRKCRQNPFSYNLLTLVHISHPMRDFALGNTAPIQAARYRFMNHPTVLKTQSALPPQQLFRHAPRRWHYHPGSLLAVQN